MSQFVLTFKSFTPNNRLNEHSLQQTESIGITETGLTFRTGTNEADLCFKLREKVRGYSLGKYCCDPIT